MTVPTQRVRRRPSVPGRLLPLVLVLALLAPVAALFVQAYGRTGDDRDLATRERLGIEYLRVLAPVTEALVEAQSAAVAGRPASPESLDRAVERVTQVDLRIGGELRSQERWSGLRAKLEALPEKRLTDREAAYTAYSEVTDLLLALYRKVRESSGLVRDPEEDSFFLQDGVGRDLPTALVAAGRLADLTVLAATRPASQATRTLGELAEARIIALGAASDLVADLRAAVGNSERTDLGATVLAPLDTYQRAVEALAAYSAPEPGSRTSLADPAQVGAARANAQSAARQLQPVILDQLDAQLVDRIDGYDRERWIAAGSAAVAALLVLILIRVLVGAFRRARRRDAESRLGTEAGPGGQPGTGSGWQPSTGPRASGTAGALASRGLSPEDHRLLQPTGLGQHGGTDPWETSDAAR
ncbi:hypothetical protein E1193_23340 [Micromonospora sp. KC606]|uniref:hypothetical protein n=1 Tax=Micromonospora sp. KC606 TaxID=2530379 RepID=UPI00104DCEA1|nr:hypothetical protein [Micromonospora sp. KC606]TDC76797.1 hypothetical protein E1193_23340 [Micromonospora sp. KC606]